MTELRCWQCGTEPLEVHDVSGLGDMPGSRLLPGRWPPGDHTHAVDKPTPEQLVAEGHAILRRILEAL